jgi:hypothetical protein
VKTWQTALWVAFLTVLLVAVTLAFVFSGAR